MARKRDILKKYSALMKLGMTTFNLFPKSIHKFILRKTRGKDGYLFMFIRYMCVKKLSKSCGENVAIFSNVYLLNISNLEIGSNVSIHPLCYIDAAGGLKIGDNVSIAHNTTIMTTEHNYDNLEINIKDQGCYSVPTIIHNNVWIGAGCRILAGSIINSGSIIAAGAVVKGEIEANSIVGGVPAKLIKKRS